MPRSIAIIEAPSILGQFPGGTETLPAALLGAGLGDRLNARRAGEVVPPRFDPEVDPETGVLNARGIAAYMPRLADAVTAALDRGEFALVLGGDCSVVLGGLLALRRRGRFGLLYVDAHADFYQPEAVPAGEAAAMDLAFATGRGPSIVTRFEGFHPLVRDEYVVVLGRRDAEDAEAAGSQRVEDTTIEVIDLARARRLGAAASVAKALERLARPELDGFWIHLDADVLDDDVMPALDYRTAGGGLTFGEVTQVLAAAMASGRAMGMDVTNLNPTRDADGSSVRNLVEALARGLCPPGARPPDPVSPAQWRALLRLVNALEAAGIAYQLSGGLAGNVHGSAWPLHDIDLDVPGARIAEVAALFPGEVRSGPARFVDDEFDLTLLRLELDGVPVDVSAADDAWIFTRTGARAPLRIDLARAERKEFRGTILCVAPLDDLIAYKQLLGRAHDVADLLRLRA